jgi:chromosomal replication initiation ATPase DnaA
MSFQALGEYFGNITRNGISNAHNRIIKKNLTDNRLKEEITNLITLINSNQKGNGAT